MSLIAILACSSRQDENFSLTPRTSCLETWNQTFWGQEAEVSVSAARLFESAR